MAKSKVSVIIPVYNVASYIERCARSLFGQTLREMEFIFVDDSSPDRSIQIVREVLKEFPHRVHQVKFLRHEQNKGLPSARNTGIEAATGEYICHCDSDDWVEPDMYERLYDEAESTHSDICWCDFYMHKKESVEYCSAIDIPLDKLQLLRTYIMSGWTVIWNMLVKRDLYQDWQIRGYEGLSFCEDYGLSVRLLSYASKVAHLPKALYHYNRTNVNSMVATSLNIERRYGR